MTIAEAEGDFGEKRQFILSENPSFNLPKEYLCDKIYFERARARAFAYGNSEAFGRFGRK